MGRPQTITIFGRAGPWRSLGTRPAEISRVGIEHEIDRTFLRGQSSHSVVHAGAASSVIRSTRFRVRTGANGYSGRGLAAVVERGGGEAGDPRFRARDHRAVEPELCLARGPHCGVRSGWHALGRASHVHASGLLPGARSGGSGEAARTQERRAIQDGAVRQPRGDGQALAARPREKPRSDADWYVSGGIQRRSEEVARNRARSALEAAVYRARLSADARSAALSARERLQDLYRDWRGPGLRAHLCRQGLRHPARAGG